MSSKSAIKVLVPPEAKGTLFKWVAILTGSKNALKCAGFFLGRFLLAVAGFAGALWIMAAALALVWATAWALLPRDLGKSKVKARWNELLSKSREIKVLCLARFFLFGARDIWFVVGVPVFLRGVLAWSSAQVGAFMATWVIGYGLIQGFAPVILRGRAPGGATASAVGLSLAAITAAIPLALAAGVPANLTIIGGLALFGAVFALNSAVHSYLILDYTDGDKVALTWGSTTWQTLAIVLSAACFPACFIKWRGWLVACGERLPSPPQSSP